jgi:hypothetical protein
MADQTCSVTIKSEIQTPEKDAQGNITGYTWTAGAAGKDQLVRVVAHMSGTCAAKISLSATSNKSNDQTHFDLVVLRQTPPAPDADTCTKHKECVFWATQIRGILGDPAPQVTFKATANCQPCDCTANPNTSSAEVTQSFAK